MPKTWIKCVFHNNFHPIIWISLIRNVIPFRIIRLSFEAFRLNTVDQIFYDLGLQVSPHRCFCISNISSDILHSKVNCGFVLSIFLIKAAFFISFRVLHTFFQGWINTVIVFVYVVVSLKLWWMSEVFVRFRSGIVHSLLINI